MFIEAQRSARITAADVQTRARNPWAPAPDRPAQACGAIAEHMRALAGAMRNRCGPTMPSDMAARVGPTTTPAMDPSTLMLATGIRRGMTGNASMTSSLVSPWRGLNGGPAIKSGGIRTCYTLADLMDGGSGTFAANGHCCTRSASRPGRSFSDMDLSKRTLTRRVRLRLTYGAEGLSWDEVCFRACRQGIIRPGRE
jgi:hypothetical protein